jgi:CheY-like chemotaxis protein
MNILLVDDDAQSLQRLGQLLRGFDLRERGFATPVRCSRASQALDLVRRDADGIGLLCCNLHMPDMDGMAFLRELEINAYRGGLVLIGHDSERLLLAAERIARAYRLRVLGSLYLPLGPTRLAPQLDRMLCRAAASNDHHASDDFAEAGQWAFQLH